VKNKDVEKEYLETQREYLVSIGERPWGQYVVLANEVDIKVKKIIVNPGERLSLQKHKLREEHWFVSKGEAMVFLNDKKIILKSGESIDVKRGDVHRIGNEGSEPLVFVEVQTGDHFGEDDIERLEDDYSR